MVASVSYWFCQVAAYACLLLLVGDLRTSTTFRLPASALAVSAIGLMKAATLVDRALTGREQLQLAGSVILLIALAAHAWHTRRAERVAELARDEGKVLQA